MPMDASVLGPAIRSAIAALPDPKAHVDVWNAIAAQIILHIQTHATITVTVTSVSGVTTGAGVSGPGTGTATIT